MPARLSYADYPGLDTAEAGEFPNVCYGEVEGVRAHCIVGGATALLVADLTALATGFDLDNASRFPATPFTVQVGYERMLVTGVSGNTLTVTRGYDGTVARAHLKNKTVYEVRSEYVYMVAPEPVKAIGRVYIDGLAQEEGFTAYTGQSGDEHTDWPGKAVVAFEAEGYIGPQHGLDTDAATTREKGQKVRAGVEWASAPELVDGSDSSYTLLSMTGRGSCRVAFAQGEGDALIRRQEYFVTVENEGASEATLRAVVADPVTGSVSADRLVRVPAATKITFSISESGGNWISVFCLVAVDDDLKVYAVYKDVTRLKVPVEDDALVGLEVAPVAVSDARVADATDSGAGLSETGVLSAWAGYASEGPGVVYSQSHSAEVKNIGASGAVVRLIAAEPGRECYGLSRHAIAVGEVETLGLEHLGGGWDAMSKVVVETGEVEVRTLTKDVMYATEETLAQRTLAHTASARAVLGSWVSVDLQGAVDVDGSYGGTGTLIERPDWVIKHFLIERMGFVGADIDDTAFSAAGALYAGAVSGGYRFGFVLDGLAKSGGKPSGVLRRLAYECRSTVRYAAGKWALAFLPDAAPAVVKTISEGDLAGEGAMFVFDMSPAGDLANRIIARYRRRYGAGRGESPWEAEAQAEDATSQSERGVYERVEEFFFVRDKATAEDVLAHMLLEGKSPLLSGRFPVFWEHFDLTVGATIDIDSGLFDGKKFFIESIERLDRFRAEVTARQWWG